MGESGCQSHDVIPSCTQRRIWVTPRSPRSFGVPQDDKSRDRAGSFHEQFVQNIADGHDAVVLGHFHTERDLSVEAAGRTGRVLVLPEWRESRRHLRATSEGEIGFVDSGA